MKIPRTSQHGFVAKSPSCIIIVTIFAYHILSSSSITGSVPVLHVHPSHLLYLKVHSDTITMDFRGNDERSLDSNIDSSLSVNPPTVSPVLDHHLGTNPGAISEESLAFLKEAAAAFSQTSSVPSPSDTSPAASPSYTPARLFQATGDVRHLARSEASLSGFTVHIYGRHTHTWILDINFSDIAIRAQIYIL